MKHRKCYFIALGLSILTLVLGGLLSTAIYSSSDPQTPTNTLKTMDRIDDIISQSRDIQKANKRLEFSVSNFLNETGIVCPEEIKFDENYFACRDFIEKIAEIPWLKVALKRIHEAGIPIRTKNTWFKTRPYVNQNGQLVIPTRATPKSLWNYFTNNKPS